MRCLIALFDRCCFQEILFLHKNPFTYFTLVKLNVAFTRVKKGSDLKALRHPIELRLLKAAYDDQGNFQKELYMAAFRKIHQEEGVCFINY